MIRRCLSCRRPVRGRAYVILINVRDGRAEVHGAQAAARLMGREPDVAGQPFDRRAVYDLACAKLRADELSPEAENWGDVGRAYA